MRKLMVAICTALLGLVPAPASAQDDVKKQLDALKLQMDQLQKTLKEIQTGQVPRKEVEDIKETMKKLEELQKSVGVLDQRTAPRPAPVAYRAEMLGAPAQLYSPVGARRGGPILSPYLNLVRNQDVDGLVTLGIDYGLSTRAEFQRRSDAREFSGQLYGLQQQAQQAQTGSGVTTTGHRAYFDQNYGRPTQQLYRRSR